MRHKTLARRHTILKSLWTKLLWTKSLWTFWFAIWCIYWFIIRKLNHGIHWDLTYPLVGYLRSRLLWMFPDEHPCWNARRYYRIICLKRRGLKRRGLKRRGLK